jgi:hypothetical protein
MSLRCSYRLGLIASLVVTSLGGCGKIEPQRATVVAVEGAVSFQGKPLPGAMIVLHPKTPRADVPTPRALVNNDGTFRVSTYEAGDGAPPGEYVATIAWYKLIGQRGDVQAGPNVLPPKYSSPKMSPWVIRVAEQPIRLAPVQLRR